MDQRTSVRFVLTLAFVGLAPCSLFADSAPGVPFSDVNGDEGLKVDVYHIAPQANATSDVSFADLYRARDYALSHPGDYTFQNTQINQSSGNDATLDFKGSVSGATAAFLGPYASGNATQDRTALNATDTIIHQFGFLHIQKGGTYRFEMPQASSGGAFFLGGNGQPGTGNLIIARNSNDIHNAPGLPNGLGLDFFRPDGVEQTGWYPFELIYLEKGGASEDAEFSFHVQGPGPVKFRSGTASGSHIATFMPLHRYSFEHTDSNKTVIDNGIADTVNGQLVGDASIDGGSLVTTGSAEGAARLNLDAITRFFHGTFTIEDWFTPDADGPDKQTLFSFAGDDHHYVLARILANNGQPKIEVQFNNGTSPVLTLQAPLRAAGDETLLSLSYDGSRDEINLYLNGTKVDSANLPDGIKLGDFIQPQYVGVSGLSALGDPGFKGKTEEFRMYRVALNPDQITQNFQIGPDHQLPNP